MYNVASEEYLLLEISQVNHLPMNRNRTPIILHHEAN